MSLLSTTLKPKMYEFYIFYSSVRVTEKSTVPSLILVKSTGFTRKDFATFIFLFQEFRIISFIGISEAFISSWVKKKSNI